MPDQAKSLRRLAREARGSLPATAARARLIVVAGGQPGVGTSTIARNLAAALAGEGKRVVMTDISQTDASKTACDGDRGPTTADVLAGTHSVTEVLRPGPGGVEVLPSPRDGQSWRCSAAAHDRLIDELRELRGRADFVVVDGGNTSSRISRRMWQAACPILMVTTPELAAVMNAYAAIKAIAVGDDLLPLWTLVNLAPSEAVAGEVHQRLATVCRRFLGLACRVAGHVYRAPQYPQVADGGLPFVLAAPKCAASEQIRKIARLVHAGDALGNTVETQFLGAPLGA